MNVWTVIDAEGFLYGPFCSIACAIKGVSGKEFEGKPAAEPLIFVQVPNGTSVKAGTLMCGALDSAIKAIQSKMKEPANVERPDAEG